jgi:DNA-binding transcriptional LysR family regulator
MNVARSVVTRQVAALEAHLGAKLLARSTRRLSLTSAGAGYLEKCREILNLVDAAEGGLSEDNQAPRGHIRMTLPLSFGIQQLMPMFGDFMIANPGVSLELDFNDRRANLIEGSFDLAIRIADHLDPGDVARKIGSSRGVIAAAPAYLARHGRPEHPKDLLGHECFGYLLAQRPSWSFVIAGELQWFPITGRLQANSGEALLTAAIQGLASPVPRLSSPSRRFARESWRSFCPGFQRRNSGSTRFSQATAMSRIGSGHWWHFWRNGSGHAHPGTKYWWAGSPPPAGPGRKSSPGQRAKPALNEDSAAG